MGLLEKQFDIWKLERMWKMGEPTELIGVTRAAFDSICDEVEGLRQRNAELEQALRHILPLIDGEFCEVCHGSGNLANRHGMACDVPKWRKLLRDKQ